MHPSLLGERRRRVPLKYVVIAILAAAAGAAGLEAAGTALSASHTGLGGTLGAPAAGLAPVSSPRPWPPARPFR